MKPLAFFLLASLGSCTSPTDTPSAAASYVAEAPLPQGWPQPGPYDQVSLKSYPAYRAAFTQQKGESRAFWKLFSHIRQNKIPMTAPLEMEMDLAKPDGEMASMAFLYQSPAVGKTGPAGNAVQVRDVAATRALSYTWQGPDSKENLTRAKTALETKMAAENIQPESFRLLGYNGPRTPRSKRTWELQALLK
jgi:hypothetical protein